MGGVPLYQAPKSKYVTNSTLPTLNFWRYTWMAPLDILYAPVVRLEKAEGGFEFEANVDEIQLRCTADGNPAPNIFWRKAGGESILR